MLNSLESCLNACVSLTSGDKVKKAREESPGFVERHLLARHLQTRTRAMPTTIL